MYSKRINKIIRQTKDGYIYKHPDGYIYPDGYLYPEKRAEEILQYTYISSTTSFENVDNLSDEEVADYLDIETLDKQYAKYGLSNSDESFKVSTTESKDFDHIIINICIITLLSLFCIIIIQKIGAVDNTTNNVILMIIVSAILETIFSMILKKIIGRK